MRVRAADDDPRCAHVESVRRHDAAQIVNRVHDEFVEVDGKLMANRGITLGPPDAPRAMTCGERVGLAGFEPATFGPPDSRHPYRASCSSVMQCADVHLYRTPANKSTWARTRCATSRHHFVTT
jgi:hypothetical protein